MRYNFLLGIAALLLATGQGVAQDDATSDRERRLREHEQRVRTLIENRQAETEAKKPAVPPRGKSAAPARPRLVVVLSIDQFRGDYIPRFERYLGEGGFRRIMGEGFHFENCYYRHATTQTGPGHATLLTGTYPHVNGIVSNDYYDMAEGRGFYCAEDAEAHPVTPRGVDESKGSFSPRRLMVPTTGDNLEKATAGAAKTVGVSLKDRSGIMMAGRAADLVLWFDSKSGEFGSSTYYTQALPQWLLDWQAGKPADAWFKKAWELSLPAEEYASVCTADDYKAEQDGSFEGRTFPHTLGWKSESPDANYYTNLTVSPFGNDLVVDAALAAVKGEGMGQDDIPDLLAISFSSNDLIGHAFGPSSWEVMDATIKTDATVARLLTALDELVGKGAYTLFVSGDHGAADLPELAQEMGIPAERFLPRGMADKLEAHLRGLYGQPAEGKRYVADFGWPFVTLNPAAVVDEAAPTARPMDEEAARFLATLPNVVMATTTAALKDGADSLHPVRRALALSMYPGRSGHLAYVMPPGWFPSGGYTGTTHGAPYSYDQSVVLLAYGNGIRQGTSNAPAQPPQIAPTVSALVGVLVPDACEVPALTAALANNHEGKNE